jgi:hypothetical protein
MKLGKSYIGNVGVFLLSNSRNKICITVSGLPLKTLMFRCLTETKLQYFNALTLKGRVQRYFYLCL